MYLWLPVSRFMRFAAHPHRGYIAAIKVAATPLFSGGATAVSHRPTGSLVPRPPKQSSTRAVRCCC